jgi:hypothetical protein
MNRVVMLVMLMLANPVVHAADSAPAVDDIKKTQKVADLIRALASDIYALRENAERDLTALDKSYLPYLKNAFEKSIDADVNSRRARIMRAVRTRGDHLAIAIELNNGEAECAFGNDRRTVKHPEFAKMMHRWLEDEIDKRLKTDDLQTIGGNIPLRVKLTICEGIAMSDVHQVLVPLAKNMLSNIQYQMGNVTEEVPLLIIAKVGSDNIVPPELLDVAILEYDLKKETLAMENQKPRRIQIDVKDERAGAKVFELNSVPGLTHAELLEALKAEQHASGITLRICYSMKAEFKHIMAIFQIANQLKTKECGLMPGANWH